MKSKFVKRLLTAFMVMTSVIVFSSCERIDAGCEGIKVNLYGDDKGWDGKLPTYGTVPQLFKDVAGK